MAERVLRAGEQWHSIKTVQLCYLRQDGFFKEMQLPKLGVITVFNTQKSQLEEDCLMVPCFWQWGVFNLFSRHFGGYFKKEKMGKKCCNYEQI